LVNELQKYDETLYQKPRWLVLNKLDMLPSEQQQEICDQFIKDLDWKGRTFKISALTGYGCQELTYAIMNELEKYKEPQFTSTTYNPKQ